MMRWTITLPPASTIIDDSGAKIYDQFYQYDKFGNLTSGFADGLFISYDAFNKPIETWRNGAEASFRYGPNGNRFRQTGSKDVVYIDNLYERVNSTEHKAYLGNYAVYNFAGSDAGLKYLHTDRLGSMVAFSDEAGNLQVTASRHFDPFGKPREADLADSTDQNNDLNGAGLTSRGFTGHEHLNSVQLIHMNGRAYDYNLGRFLSVDPFIQFPENSQSLNPYSYIMNNPMSGTDPTGYCTGTRIVANCALVGGRLIHSSQRETDDSDNSSSNHNGNDDSSSTSSSTSSPEDMGQPSGVDIKDRSNVVLHGLGPYPTSTTTTQDGDNVELLIAGTEPKFRPVPPLVNVTVGVAASLIGGVNAFSGENAPGDDSIEAGEFSPLGVLKAGATAGSLILRRGSSVAKGTEGGLNIFKWKAPTSLKNKVADTHNSE